MKRACAVVEVPVPEGYNRLVAQNGSRDLTDREICFFNWGIELEGDNDMPPSNCSIGADAPASAAFKLQHRRCHTGFCRIQTAAFGKTAFADFAPTRCKMRVLLILVDGMRPDCELPSG